MRINKSTIPPGSLVCKFLPADYDDTFTCEVEGARKISPDDLMVAFWSRAGSPGWVGALFRLRNFLVRFVGLKGSDGMNDAKLEAAIRSGGSWRFISVADKSPDDTVLLLSGSHLDAWLSVRVAAAGTAQKVSVITLVRFKNRLGRVYFWVIHQFHSLIVKSMLARAVEKIIE